MTVVEIDRSLEILVDEEADGDVQVSIRPEDVDLHENGDGLAAGTVSERYFQGDQTNYRVDLDAGPALTVVIQGRERGVRQGDEVSVDVDADAPVVFS